MKRKILISTGGSGGHVIPATIFHEHLKNDYEIYLSTDKRGLEFLDLKKYRIKIINTPKLINKIFLLPLNLVLIIFLSIKSLFFLKKKHIDILISTGGYMSLPLCLAAKILNIKIYLFEPNMVLGRANKFFLRIAEKIFCYSNKIKYFPQKYIKKIALINPLLRKEFYSIQPNQQNQLNDEINLLIIGGSQGAKLFDSELKETIFNLSKKYTLKIYHQVGTLNKNNLEEFYKKHNIDFKIFNFEKNIFNLIDNVNLSITRAGASTLSELTFLNIPYIAIPYSLAKDDHQFQNALFYKDMNCCWMLKENEFKSEILTKHLTQIIENKDDYFTKKVSMKKFSYQNSWNKINQKLISIINEN